MKKSAFALGSLIALTQVLAADQAPVVLEETVVKEPTSVITPAITPVQDGCGLYFTADFIWWKAQLSGTGYAGTGVQDNNVNVPTFTSPKKGKITTPDFSFEPGVKVGAGIDAQHDGWDLYANWTWLHGDENHNHLDSKPGLGETMIGVTATPFGTLTSVPVLQASSDWKQRFNVLDLELGRNFFVSHRIALRPFGGLKAAWITEDLLLHYTTTANNTLLASTTYRIDQHRHQRMWGLGMRGGINSVWQFNNNWGVYGDFAATALWSDFHVRAKDKYTNVGTGAEFKDVHTGSVITQVNMVFEAGMGLTYMTWFSNDQYQFKFKAGWEEQVWLNFSNFTGLNQSGNLTLQGLTLMASLGF
jgi:hypothetical protein